MFVIPIPISDCCSASLDWYGDGLLNHGPSIHVYRRKERGNKDRMGSVVEEVDMQEKGSSNRMDTWQQRNNVEGAGMWNHGRE